MYEKLHRWSEQDEGLVPDREESPDGHDQYDADVEELGGHTRQILRDDE